MRNCSLLALVISALLAPAGVVLAQQTERTTVSYAVSDSDMFYSYRLTFWKDKDSSVFRGMQFRVRPLDPKRYHSKPRLADCVPAIGRLWDAAADSIAIALRSLDVGYPVQFPDVLRRQIEVFTASSDWRKQLKMKKAGHDYRTLGSIMAEGQVFGCLDSLLAARGYVVTSIGTEKHGYLLREDYQRLGPRPELRGLRLRDVPLPFIVTIDVGPSGPRP